MRRFLIILFLRAFGIKFISNKFYVTDYTDFTKKFIEDTLKRRGFVLLNKKGEYWLNSFTLIQIFREKKTIDKKDREVITKIEIRHDINNVIGKPIKAIEIKNRVTDLELFIDYFSKT